jgi:sortase A
VKKKKSTFSNIILIGAFLIGLSLLLYPTVSNYWNSIHQSQAIATYTGVVVDTNDEDKEKMWQDAVVYNKRLASSSQMWKLTDSERMVYEQMLNVSETGVMCCVDIPDIKVSLPVYHGVEESVLQIGIGHLEGSSLPVGGKSTHCVISGHRGLPSAKLFSNLDKLEEGDIFTLTVLDEILTYEIDQIRIVEPEDVSELEIVQGKDYCTLVTCTPYGVNSHRLLVRGHRIENIADYTNISADAIQIDKLIVAPIIAVPIIAVLFVVVMISTRRKVG